jgi:hypothetical protein
MITLISFSKDYAQQMIEFLSACSASDINFIMMQSSFETDNDSESNEEDEFAIKPEKIKHLRNYIIISGSLYSYNELYNNIDSLSNDILLAIQNDIYNKCSSSAFTQQIDANVLDLNLFKHKKIEPKYDEVLRFVSLHSNFQATNYKAFINKIPNGFSDKDILSIMKYVSSDDNYHKSNTFLDFINKYQSISDEEGFLLNDCIGLDMFGFIWFPSSCYIRDKLVSIANTPKYLIQDEDKLMNSIDYESLDDIFMEKYNRFMALTEYNEYEDVDTVLKEEESDDNGD